METRAKKKCRLETMTSGHGSEKKAATVGHSFIFARTFGHRGGDERQLHSPMCVAVGIDGVLYVADFYKHRIQCFDCDGNFLRQWGSRGDCEGQFQFPTSVALGMHDGINESITKAVRGIPHLSAFPPGVLPICLAYVGSEYIYVVDALNHRIQVFGYNAKTIRTWGREGHKDGEFVGPWGCSVSVSGIVYVTDTYNRRIQAFRSDGTFVRKWGTRGSGEDEFLGPRGICASRDGLVFITDIERVMCFRDDGTLAREWAPQADVVRRPSGITISDDDNMVYVTDQDCIRQFHRDGTFVRKWGTAGQGDGQFDLPSGIAKGADNLVYVADTNNHRIVVITLPL